MRILFLGLLVAGLVSGCATVPLVPVPFDNEQTFQAGYEATWAACLKAIGGVTVLEPILIASSDKESGVITTQPVALWPQKFRKEYAKCDTGEFWMGMFKMTLNFYVRPASESQTTVKIVSRTTDDSGVVFCVSRGTMEAKLFSAIAAALPAPK